MYPKNECLSIKTYHFDKTLIRHNFITKNSINKDLLIITYCEKLDFILTKSISSFCKKKKKKKIFCPYRPSVLRPRRTVMEVRLLLLHKGFFSWRWGLLIFKKSKGQRTIRTLTRTPSRDVEWRTSILVSQWRRKTPKNLNTLGH